MRIAAALLAGIVTLAAAEGSALTAQDTDGLRERCRTEAPTQSAPSCGELAVAVEGLQGSLGLAGTGGGLLPGSSTTLGRRYPDGPPRFAVGVSASLIRFRFPDIVGPQQASGGQAASRIRPAFKASLAGGLFEGFRLRPAVGGVLALDLFADLGWISLPTDTEGSGVFGGVGARLGILRESFDVPAITLIGLRNWTTEARHGGAGPSATGVTVAPGVTALRGMISKDLGGLGLTVGGGRDWYGGGAALHLSDGRRLEEDSFSNGRWIAFLSGTLNYVVLFVEGEVGWAGATNGLNGGGSPFEPEGAAFVGLSLKLIF